MKGVVAMLVLLGFACVGAHVRAGDAAQVPRLIEKLIKDKEAANRQAAAMKLGQLGPKAEAAVPALVGAFKDKDTTVRDEAAQALRKIGEPAVEDLLDAMRDPDEFTRVRAIKTLGEIGPKALLTLTPILDAHNDPNSFVREAARTAYDRIKFEARDAIPMLSDADEKVRKKGVQLLWVMTAEQARPGVSELCKTVRQEKVRQIRADAVYALAVFCRDRELTAAERNNIVSTLGAALKDQDEGIRIRAARSLASYGTVAKAALPAVQQALKTAKSPELKEYLEIADASLSGKPIPEKKK